MKKILFVCSILAAAQLSIAQNDFDPSFFSEVDVFLKKQVENGQVNYAALAEDDSELEKLVEYIAAVDISKVEDATRQAFYINAYNLLVIHSAIQKYPLESVVSVPGFFDGTKRTVAGEKLTLNQLEKDRLLKVYKEPRYHFVLVCGAKDCPPITNFAYTPDKLEEQLDMQTRKALNNPGFVKVNAAESKVGLSQIFEWYSAEFGGNKKAALAYINSYREEKVPADFAINFYTYDWALNAIPAAGTSSALGNNASRYVVSASRPKGTTETKIFNNLYTQTFGSNGERTDRSTFFYYSIILLVWYLQ